MYSLQLQRFVHLCCCLALVGLLAGCEIFGGDDNNNALDDELETTLRSEAPNQDLAYFRMPASDDFASIPQDPKNPMTAAKVALGQLLYHETALSINVKHAGNAQTASCASCHHAAAGFQAGRIQGIGEGGIGFGERGEGRVNDPNIPIEDLDVQPIRTPTAMNGAYQELMLWNGQFGGIGDNIGTEANWTADTPKENNHLGYHGLETQAVAGLSVHRMADVDTSIVATEPTYVQMYADAFPGQALSRENAGLAIAAYERTLLANEAPFQRWLQGDSDAMTDAQKRGAILFFGKADCAACHTGPALNSMTFHALGMPDLDGDGVYGNVPVDEGESLGRGGFTGNAADNYKFKTPQLYNLKDSPFMGHGGTFRSVREVIEYKNRAQAARSEATSHLSTMFVPLNLTEAEVADLTAFVENGLYDANLARYVPASLPSGNCFPVNDAQARIDLGCD